MDTHIGLVPSHLTRRRRQGTQAALRLSCPADLLIFLFLRDDGPGGPASADSGMCTSQRWCGAAREHGSGEARMIAGGEGKAGVFDEGNRAKVGEMLGVG
jgi:hypothetical protein